MRPDGSEFKSITHDIMYMSMPTYAMAVVPDKQLIYVAHGGAVAELTYDGVVRREIATGANMLALDHDNISHMLYYNNGTTLKRWSLAKNESVTIRQLSHTPVSIKFYRNSLYIAFIWSHSSNAIGVVSLNKEEVVYTKLGHADDSWTSMCLIP